MSASNFSEDYNGFILLQPGNYFFLKILFIFRERGREGEREGEKHGSTREVREKY